MLDMIYFSEYILLSVSSSYHYPQLLSNAIAICK